MSGEIGGLHGLRVSAEFLNVDDLYPTYFGLWEKHTTGTGTPTYAGLVTDYTSYADLLNNAGASGVELVEDITCDVSGLTITRGRESVRKQVKAGTLAMTINDHDGRHDPRRVPAGPSRTGAKILVEVDPENQGRWWPLFCGFVESWSRDVRGESDFAEVDVSASDLFSVFARAEDTPLKHEVGLGEFGHARIERILNAANWLPKWGPKDIEAASTTEYNATVHGTAALDEIHEVTRSEDGIFYADADGTIRWRADDWRQRRNPARVTVDAAGVGLAGAVCPTEYVAADDDLDLINRMIVSRSVEFDRVPDGQGGFKTPDPAPKTAEDPASINRHGIFTEAWDGLPHRRDARSQVLVDRWVDRYAEIAKANMLGDFQFSFISRPFDAKRLVGLDWGDAVLVFDDAPTRFLSELRYELVSVEHSITPTRWEMTLGVDHWLGADQFPTGDKWAPDPTPAVWGVDQWR